MDKTLSSTSTDRLSWWLYVAVVVVAFLPVMIWRDFTPSNELRYLSIVDEALRDGTFFTFHNHGEVYADKPPLYFWIMMLCRVIAGKHCMWLLSLFSLIPALVVVRVMDLWTAPQMDAAWRRPARLMLITCGLFAGLAVTLRQDMLMTMFIVLSMRCFWSIWQRDGQDTSSPDEIRGRRRLQWALGFLVFMALMSKGPIGVMMPVLCIITFLAVQRRLSATGHYIGWRFWLILAALTATWFLCAAHEGGWGYVHNLCFHQTMDRAVSAFTHKRPFWYYFVAIWYCALPWSLMVIGVLLAGWIRHRRNDALERLLGVTTIVTLVMLSCISSKLQVYMAPVFPFLIYLGGLRLADYDRNVWVKAALGIVAFVFICLIPAAHMGPGMYPEISWLAGNAWVYAGCYALGASGLVTIVLLCSRRRMLPTAVKATAYGVLTALFCAGWALPGINAWIGYTPVCQEALEEGRKKNGTEYYAYLMHRPENMDALLHDDIHVLGEPSQLDSIDWSHAVVIAPEKAKGDFAGKRMRSVGPYLILTEQ